MNLWIWIITLLLKVESMNTWLNLRIDSNKMSFLEVVLGYTQCWKSDANFRSQFSHFVLIIFSIRLKRCLQDQQISYDIKMHFSQIAKTEIWNLRHPSNIAYGRVQLRETAFYYCPSIFVCSWDELSGGEEVESNAAGMRIIDEQVQF